MHVTDGVDVVSALAASGTEVAVVGPNIAILGARSGAIGAHIDGRPVSDEPSGPSKERRVATELPPSRGRFFVGQTVAMTQRYLSRTEVVEWIGVKPGTARLVDTYYPPRRADRHDAWMVAVDYRRLKRGQAVVSGAAGPGDTDQLTPTQRVSSRHRRDRLSCCPLPLALAPVVTVTMRGAARSIKFIVTAATGIGKDWDRTGEDDFDHRRQCRYWTLVRIGAGRTRPSADSGWSQPRQIGHGPNSGASECNGGGRNTDVRLHVACRSARLGR